MKFSKIILNTVIVFLTAFFILCENHYVIAEEEEASNVSGSLNDTGLGMPSDEESVTGALVVGAPHRRLEQYTVRLAGGPENISFVMHDPLRIAKNPGT